MNLFLPHWPPVSPSEPPQVTRSVWCHAGERISRSLHLQTERELREARRTRQQTPLEQLTR